MAVMDINLGWSWLASSPTSGRTPQLVSIYNIPPQALKLPNNPTKPLTFDKPPRSSAFEMKATAALSALTMAVAAIAAPSDIEARGASSACSSKSRTHKQVCCNGLLNCGVQVFGSNCDGDAYCCQTNQIGVVNVALLNCVALDL